jgi:plastocyanin
LGASKISEEIKFMKSFKVVLLTAAATALIASFGISLMARPADTGSISGKVSYQGKPPVLRPINMDKDPVCASEEDTSMLPQDGQVNSNGTLPNAFVYISKGSGNLNVPAPSNSVTLTQKGCMFEPHVLGIMVGQPLQIVTDDPTTHNIHLTAKEGNRDWNVTQQPGTPSVTTKFTHPAIMVPVHCNIHPWMEAYIGVVTNPYYAVTGDDGAFVIKSVPPGEYTLSLWTATFGTQERSVVVRAGESAKVDFTATGQ